MKNAFYILLLAVLLMAGCGRPAETTLSAELQRAEELMYPAPDSALHILQDMTPPKDELNHATWALLLTQAKYKCFVDQSDSLVNIAYDYFTEGDDAQRKALTLFCKAALYEEQDKSEEALSYYLKATKCFDECHDYRLGYLIYTRTAFIYINRELHDYAIDYMEKANEFALLSKDPYYIVSSYNSMARLSSSKKNYTRALEYYNKAIEIGNNYNEKIIVNNALQEKVFILTKQQKYKEALIIAEMLKNTSRSQQLYLTLGYLYSELNQVDSAYFYLNKATNSDNIYTKRSTYQALFNLSKNQNDYKKNAEYSVKLWKINDSINKIDKHKALIEMQEKYDEQRVRDEMTTQMALQQQRTWMAVCIGFVIIIAISSFIAYRIRIRNRERIIRLAEAEDRIETLNRMLEEAQNATSADEKDHAFIKRILLQQLGVIRLVANTPTAQNQALLRRLAEIGNNEEAPAEELIVWEDLYPIIDRLYDNFHARLTEQFGSLLTDKEVQTCCLLCAGFSTKEIAVITRQAVATVYMRKSTSRQKMNAPEGADIVEWVKKE